MGYKSTTTLTRASAETQFIELFLKKKAEARQLKAEPLIKEAGYMGRPYMRDGDDLHCISDEAVIALYHHVDAKIREANWTVKARIAMAPMTDTDLENELETLNDDVGYGGKNYTISEYTQED